MKKILITILILISLLTILIVSWYKILINDASLLVNILKSIPLEYRLKIIENKYIKKELINLNKDFIKKELNNYLYSYKTKHELFYSEDSNKIYINFDKYNDNIKDKNKYEDKINKIIINAILKKKDFNYNNIIKSYNYVLNENKLQISLKKDKNKVKEDYYDKLIKEIENIPIEKYKINELFFDYLSENSIETKDSKVIEINFDKLEKSIIPNLEKEMELISFRTRKEFVNDSYYRRYNIKKVYDTIEDNLFIFDNKNLEFSFNDVYNKDDDWYSKYKNWYAIVDDKEKKTYGGWVCWAATWFFQWSLLNSWLEIKSINHSIWYSHLYPANINWKQITTPWLDSTYFAPFADLKIKNITNYPIWMINKVENNIEQNYTISFKINKLKEKSLNFENKSGNCYTWKIDKKFIKSCYKKVL